MLLMLVGRLVSVMIDICKNKIGEEVCVCVGRGEGGVGGRGEVGGGEGSGRWGGKREVGREKEERGRKF